MASVKTTITEQGLALIDTIINGSGELAFTGIEIGDGENLNSSALATELTNKRMDVVISKVYSSEDGTIVCGNVENSTVTESFEIREIGVFAKQEGSENAPILFAYTECEGIGGIPAASIVAINNEMLITLATGNANVIYADNPTAALTRQDIVELRKHLTENYFTKSDIRSGVQTQTIFGYDPITGEDTKNAMYLTGNTITVMIDGKKIAFPVEAGTLALKSELDGKANKTHTHEVGDINATLALYEEANDSTRGSNERHGKVIFVTNNADDGGIYIGGSRSTRITWTQWLSRFQWDKIRAYGNTNGQYEDYVLTPKEDGSNADKQIARKKDLEGKQDKLKAGDNITIAEDGTISATGGSGGTIPDHIVTADSYPSGMTNALVLKWDTIGQILFKQESDRFTIIGNDTQLGYAELAYKSDLDKKVAGEASPDGQEVKLNGVKSSDGTSYDFTLKRDFDAKTVHFGCEMSGAMAMFDETLPTTEITDNLGRRIDTLEQGGTGGSSVTVDTELSDTSENPVQNKAVKAALDGKQDAPTDIYGTAFGYNASVGMSATAIGGDATAGSYSTAIGTGATADSYSTAIGLNASATDSGNVAIGYRAEATDDTPIVIGGKNSNLEDLPSQIKVNKDGVMTVGGNEVAMKSNIPAHGINPDGAVSHTATQTYDETSGYTYTKDVTATENGYLSCQATQSYETEGNNKIILNCSINGTVIHKDCANGYGDMASILIPIAKGQTVNVQATSTEPATMEVKFLPLNS